MTENQDQYQGLVLTRVFDAPRELVFNVWTDPKHFGNWWGPEGFSLEVVKWMYVLVVCSLAVRSLLTAVK
jgi:uncharacterized protein YndB with AHSA1/START domain